MAAEGTGFRFFGTTADVGLRVRAPGLDGLFAAAAEALFSGMCDRRTVRARVERKVALEADGVESLLVAWIDEIIYLFETEGFLGRTCRVGVEAGGKRLRAVLGGERLDPSRHRIRTVFKAATWHRLSVRRRSGTWRATVVLDV